jgi:predicted site-specific integrase-resolvase
MKLSTWAKKQGICYLTAYRLFKAGKLPVKAIQLGTGTILVEEDTPVVEFEKVVLYSRVSTSSQKEDGIRQLERLRNFASLQGYKIHKEYLEIASGLNSNRKMLNSILEDKSITKIVVEYKDRLARFGFGLVEASLKAQGREIIVINNEECKDDLVKDTIDFLTSICARLYSRRRLENKKKKIEELFNNEDS